MANWDQSLNTTHIVSDIANYEAARSAFFTLIVDGIDNMLKPNYTGTEEAAQESDRIALGQNKLRLNVVKAPVPNFSVGTSEYRRGNDVVKFATIPTWRDGSLTVDDVVGLDTKSVLMAWLYQAYNPNTRKGGRMANYKKRAQLCEYTQDYELIRTWNIEGIFITGLEEGDFDRENDGKRQITANFVFDRATVDLPEEAEA